MHKCASSRTGMLLGPLLLVLLCSCGHVPTYAETRATAQVSGCWPDMYPTPAPATITPQAKPTPTTVTGPGTPTFIPANPPSLPTTTPYPRCPPNPGATRVPWPTPVPNPPPYPTMAPRLWQSGSAQQTTLHLPDAVLGIDLAAHPTEGWPAVAAIVWSGTDAPDRVLVAAYHPTIDQWSSARQVDLGPAAIGRSVRSVAITITGDRTIHVVWGMSDPGPDNDPPGALWTSDSADFGASWSTPQRIASDCRQVNSLTSSVDGWLVAQVICHRGANATQPAMIVRRPDGVWLSPERLPIPSWYYSEGSVVITGTGANTRAIGILFAGQGVPTAFFISKRLTDSGSWQIATRRLQRSDGLATGLRMWHVRGLVAARSVPSSPAVLFTWTDAEQGSAYALTSLDGGVSWGALEPVVQARSDAPVLFTTPAYDPIADQFVMIWTCCGDDQWEPHGTTHYASWSAPGSGNWQPTAVAGDSAHIPLVLGARSAFTTVTAQAANSRSTWVAWIEQQQQVEVRTVALNQVIPGDQYPTATALPGRAP